MTEHAEVVQLGMHLEQLKNEARDGAGWRRFHADEQFLAWLQQLPHDIVAQWVHRFAGEDARGCSVDEARRVVSELAPMPDEVLQHFLVSSYACRRADPSDTNTFSPRVEYLVSLAQQCLVAHHTLVNSTLGPRALSMLRRQCLKRMAMLGEDWWEWRAFDIAEVLNYELESTAVLHSSVRQHGIERAAQEVLRLVRDVVNRAQDVASCGREFHSLVPKDLALARTCGRCHPPLTVLEDEDALPPFSETCRCFQLMWRLPGLTAYERQLRVWALDAKFNLHWPMVRFPVREFLERARALDLTAKQERVASAARARAIATAQLFAGPTVQLALPF